MWLIKHLVRIKDIRPKKVPVHPLKNPQKYTRTTVEAFANISLFEISPKKRLPVLTNSDPYTE